MRLATLVQMTFPGAPCIYYGTEIGLEGDIDPDCRGLSLDRRRTRGTRTSSRSSRPPPPPPATPVLRRGSFRIAGAEGSVIAWVMEDVEAAALVLLNNADNPATLAVPAGSLAGRTLRAAPLPGEISGTGDPRGSGSGTITFPSDPSATIELTLPARSGRVLLA